MDNFLVLYLCPKCERYSATKVQHISQDEESPYEVVLAKAKDKLQCTTIDCRNTDFDDNTKLIFKHMEEGLEELNKLNNTIVYQMKNVRAKRR